MQNLVVKLLVLSGVIGGSCFVVWQAHEGLQAAADKLDLGEFVALPEADAGTTDTLNSADREKSPASPAAKSALEEPLVLGTPAAEPVPTLAAPKQSENESPLAFPANEIGQKPASDSTAQTEMKEDAEFPLFLAETVGEKPANVPQPENDAADELALPTAPEQQKKQAQSDLAMKSNVGGAQFLELPDQQIERPSQAPTQDVEKNAEQKSGESDTPKAAIANFLDAELPQSGSTLPAQSERPEPVKLLSERFGPLAQGEAAPGLPSAPPQQSETTQPETTHSETAREMPGLTKLPPSHPGPVLLPTPKMATDEEPEPTPARHRVIQAEGIESELEPARTISGSFPAVESAPAAPPREFVPDQAAPLMPAGLPQPEEHPAASPRQLPVGDPFGLPVAPAPAAKAAPAGEVPADKEVLPEPVDFPAKQPASDFSSLPKVTPAAGTRSPLEMQTPSELPEQSEIQQIGGTLPPRNRGAVLPPLPPTGEVLPEIVPKGNPASGSTTPPPALPGDAVSTVPNLPSIGGAIPQTQPLLSNENPMTGRPASQPIIEEVMPLPPERKPQSVPELPPQLPQQAKSTPPLGIEATPAGAPPAVSPFAAQQQPAMPPTVPVNRQESMQLSTPPSLTPTEPVSQLIGTAEVSPNVPQGPQSPELKIEKIAPADAQVGEPVVYAIVVRNVGGSEARDVVVEDRIPRGAQLEGTIPQAYLNDGKLSWQLGTMKPGDEHKIQLKVIPIEAGQIGSVATVSFASAVSASIKVTAPRLTIDMTGPTEGLLGETMTYRFVMKNQGQGMAKNVYLRTILPPGLKHPGGNDLEYEAGTLPPGGEKIVDLALQADQRGVFTIQSQVTNDGKVHAETRADLTIIKSRLELTRTGPEHRFVGRPANYTLKIQNTSSDELRGITIQEKIAPGIELAAIPGGGRWDPRARLITWKLEKLGPGEAREINLLYVASEAGDHAGALVAVDDAGNRCELNTNLSVKGFADLSLNLNADQRNVVVGERISLVTALKNEGSAMARNMRVQFILPDDVEFAAARGPVDYELKGNQVIFQPIPELAMGAHLDFHLAVTAKKPGTCKVTMKLEAAEYSEPMFEDQALRIIAD